MRLTVLGVTWSSAMKTDFPLGSTPVTTRLMFIAPPRLASRSERRVPSRGPRPHRLLGSGAYRAGGPPEAGPVLGRGRGHGSRGEGSAARSGVRGQERHPERVRVLRRLALRS